jgi:hypothetical protein
MPQSVAPGRRATCWAGHVALGGAQSGVSGVPRSGSAVLRGHGAKSSSARAHTQVSRTAGESGCQPRVCSCLLAHWQLCAWKHVYYFLRSALLCKTRRVRAGVAAVNGVLAQQFLLSRYLYCVHSCLFLSCVPASPSAPAFVELILYGRPVTTCNAQKWCREPCPCLTSWSGAGAELCKQVQEQTHGSDLHCFWVQSCMEQRILIACPAVRRPSGFLKACSPDVFGIVRAGQVQSLDAGAKPSCSAGMHDPYALEPSRQL